MNLIKHPKIDFFLKKNQELYLRIEATTVA